MLKVAIASVVVSTLLVLTSNAAYGAQPQVARPQVSEANRVNLKQAQEALVARRYTEVVTNSNAALANPNRTRDDTFAAYTFLYEAARAQEDQPGMMKALEGQIGSGFLPPAGVNLVYRNLVGMAYRQKDYRSAINYGQQLINGGDASPEVYQWVGQAYYELKEFAASVKFFDDLVKAKEKRGLKPGRNELILLQQSQDKAGNKEASQVTLEKLVRHYPDASTWALLLHAVKRERLDSRQTLHLYRLIAATGNMKHGGDYMAYSDAALKAGLHAESRKVLETGLKANAFTAAEKVRAERYVISAASRADASRVALPLRETEAKSAPTGDKYVLLGMMHFSFDDYGKAISALQAGIARGGLGNLADARLSLGEAQLKAGQKAEALKTFRTTDTDNEISRRLLQLWALYAS